MPTKVPVQQGGTQLTSIPAGSILAAQSTNVLSAVASTSGVKYLKNNNGVISWDTVNFDTSNLVPYTGATQDVNLGTHNITANNLSGTNTGDETTLSIKTKLGQASSTTDGYLTSADWNTFNNKQNALGYTPENIANKGVANGYAPLNSSTKIDDNYLSQPISTTASPTFAGLKLNPSSQPTGVNGLIYYDSINNKFEFYQNGAWVELGSGNVIGPSSSTDNDIVLFNGTTGTLIKDSGKTLPSGAVVGTSDTQTLQNKTLDNTNVIAIKDGNLIIQNSTDITKQAKFDTSGITASTTRTYTLPDANTTLVGTDVAQTLTNKTLTDAKLISAINVQTGTAYTLVLTDASKLIIFTNASAITVTVPSNASVAFPIGTQIDLVQGGTGKVTVSPASGVTINSQSGNKSIAGQWVGVSLIKTDTDTWLLLGNLTT